MIKKSKVCSKCGLTKSSNDFGPDKRARDGLKSWCKVCCSEAEQARYRENPERARATARAIHLQNPERSRFNNRSSYHHNLEYSRAQGRASEAVRRAVARGELIKPDHCEVCNKLESAVAGGLEGHHYLGYAREHYLDVQWLCIEDHRKAERAMEVTG